MIPVWPEAEEERKTELRDRAARWRKEQLISEDQLRAIEGRTVSTWRSNGFFLSIVLFVFTLLTVSVTFSLLRHWGLSKGILTAVLAIAVAEVLILRFRFFGTGVESALWISGLFAWIFGLSGPSRPEALLLFAAAAGLAGFRVRNPLFGALAAVFIVTYLIRREWLVAAAVAGLGVSLVALLALRHEWRRPSTEMLWIALLVIPPIAGAVATEALSPLWSLAYLAAACACVVSGLRGREHAPLIAACVHLSISIGVLVAHDLLPWRLEWCAIAGGAIALLISSIVSRALRDRTRGIVVKPSDLTTIDEALQIAGTVALQPKAAGAPPPETRGGGGDFGGAGATGKF